MAGCMKLVMMNGTWTISGRLDPRLILADRDDSSISETIAGTTRAWTFACFNQSVCRAKWTLFSILPHIPRVLLTTGISGWSQLCPAFPAVKEV